MHVAASAVGAACNRQYVGHESPELDGHGTGCDARSGLRLREGGGNLDGLWRDSGQQHLCFAPVLDPCNARRRPQGSEANWTPRQRLLPGRSRPQEHEPGRKSLRANVHRLLMKTRWIQERLRAEEGFTLIEVLVAAVLLVTALLVLVASLDSERRLGDNAQAQGAAAQFAERELDTLLARPYNELALNRLPTTVLDGSKPTASWGSTRLLLPSALPTNDERTDVNTVFCADTQCPSAVPSVSDWTSDKPAVRGKVYRYVTWVNDASCPDADCPGTTDYKRITVAVLVTDSSGAIPTIRQGPRVPIVVSAVKINPKLITGNISGQGTPCDAPGVTCS